MQNHKLIIIANFNKQILNIVDREFCIAYNSHII